MSRVAELSRKQKEAQRTSDALDLVSDGLLSIREACAFLSLGKTKIYELMSTGELPYVSFGGCRRIPRRALVQYAASRLRGKTA